MYKKTSPEGLQVSPCVRLPKIEIQFLVATRYIFVHGKRVWTIGSWQPAEDLRASLLYQIPNG
jgi:hypothetical protein